MDQSTTLWCGWVIEEYEADKRLSASYFAGDTGYRRYASSDETCPAFKGTLLFFSVFTRW